MGISRGISKELELEFHWVSYGVSGVLQVVSGGSEGVSGDFEGVIGGFQVSKEF